MTTFNKFIEDMLQASINMDAINGDNMERAVVGMQMQEAVYEIRKLRAALAEKRNADNVKEVDDESTIS